MLGPQAGGGARGAQPWPSWIRLSPAAGQPLPPAIQRKMEAAFGADFSGVRVKVGPEAAAVGAHAFALGNDLYFAPGRYRPETPDGQRLLGHELAHVIQQRQGRVRNPLGSGIAIVSDPALEAEADRLGARAAASPAIPASPPSGPKPAARPAIQCSRVLQPSWEQTSLNDRYLRWNRLKNGVRWYKNKREDYGLYYYMVEQPTPENRHMIKGQGSEMRLGDFAFAGMDEPPTEMGHPATPPEQTDWRNRPYAPFLYRPVRHSDKDQGYWSELTAYRLKSDDKQFAKATGAAFPQPAKIGETASLKDIRNAGLHVYHLTALRNLHFSPGTTAPGTGILARGLDPTKGGGPGGACETCKILNDRSMLEGSIKNSRNVVAVTSAASNLKMYGNQRHEYSLQQFAEGKYNEQDLVGAESILLRFKLEERHVHSMVIDPQHPKDAYVRLIYNIRVPPESLEALTSDGWVKLPTLSAIGELFPNSARFGNLKRNQLNLQIIGQILDHVANIARGGLKSHIPAEKKTAIAKARKSVIRLLDVAAGKTATFAERDTTVDGLLPKVKGELGDVASAVRAAARQHPDKQTRQTGFALADRLNAYAGKLSF